MIAAREADNSGGHFLTALGALATCGDAILHPVELFAARRARPANLGALATDMLMMRGLARHKVYRNNAHLRAIGHDLNMLRRGVLPAHFKTMVHRHVKAGHMTFVAGVHARLHVGVDLVHHSLSV